MTASAPTPDLVPDWQPYREPLRETLLRTGLIAVTIGAVLAGIRGSWALWPIATLLVLWPSFGGHWVEIVFLNWLRPRLPGARIVQIVARLLTWFVGGILLTLGVVMTLGLFHQFQPFRRPPLWIGGLAFIGIELVAHAVLQLRGRPGFYNGRG